MNCKIIIFLFIQQNKKLYGMGSNKYNQIGIHSNTNHKMNASISSPYLLNYSFQILK